MSNDPTNTRPLWAPTSSPSGSTAVAPPPVAPTYPPPAWTPSAPVAPVAPVAPRYASAGSPPVAGGGQPPTWPPAAADPFATGPDAPPTKPGRSAKGRGRSLVAVAAISALFAGVAGGAIGAYAVQQDVLPSNETAAKTTPVSTQVPPVSGDAEEPAAAVAAALGPAVVQIETQSGLGSGFIYDESGLILTAFHVTEGADTVDVRMADGTRVEGQVVGFDASTDVSVVKIDPVEGMAVATLGTGVPVEVGQLAIAIGSPFGLDQSVTAGIVSAVGRSAETPGGVIPAIQTDAPINTGNSGGALADRSGRVIGINDSIVTGGGDSTGNLGVGFAIPIDIAKSVADRIVAGESTEAGFLGVEGTDATGGRAGAAISSVAPDSPAARAGLAESDVVVAIDGAPVSSMLDLAAKIRTRQPGDTVELTVESDGSQRTVSVTLETAPGN